MPAAACLQVIISSSAEILRAPDVMTIVGKVTGAFLEARWSWPRKHAALSKSSYMLIDPRADELDPHELQQLSAELQLHLFGMGGGGDVTLALFEGTPKAISQFAQLSPKDVLRALSEGTDFLGIGGRLTKINPQGIEPEREIAAPNKSEEKSGAPDDYKRNRALYRGIYLTPKQQFVGNIVSRWNPDDKRLQSVLDGPAHYPSDPEMFDRETVATFLDANPAGSAASSHMMLPLNYSMLMRRSGREHYAKFLEPLARHWPRERLTATLYDAPRMVQHFALVDIKSVLTPYFVSIDLCVADPAIDLDLLEVNAVGSITLALSGSNDEMLRDATIKRFMRSRQRFRDKGIWPMIGNVRTRHEVQTCANSKAPFIYGPAITQILEAPIGATQFMAEGLPLPAAA